MFCSSCWTSYSWIHPKSSGTRLTFRLRASAIGPSCRWSSELVTRELLWTLRVRARRRVWYRGEGGLEVVGLRVGEQRRQREGVLDRGVRALSVVGEHPVGGVAEDHHPPTVPAQQGTHGEQRPGDRARGRADHLGDGRVPAAEGGDGQVLVDVGHRAGVQPDLRCLDDREEVHVLAVAADRVVQHVGVRSHPELDGLRVGQRRQVLDGHDAAEGAGPGVHGVVGPGHEPADRRTDPVRADDEVGALDAAVGELQHDRVAFLDDVDQPAAEVQVLAAERAAQRLLDVGAVDPEVRRAEPLLVPVVLPDRVRRDPARRPASAGR